MQPKNSKITWVAVVFLTLGAFIACQEQVDVYDDVQEGEFAGGEIEAAIIEPIDTAQKKLLYFGPSTPYINTLPDGTTVQDTLFHVIPEFVFTDQDGKKILPERFDGMFYASNFFFTSCPSICPKMTAQLKRVSAALSNMDDFRIISHTVDPKRDTVETLKAYATNNDIDTSRWSFATGSKEAIYEVAYRGYFLNANEDAEAPGGFLHSEMIVLVDKEKHIRGLYDGTETAEMDRLVRDVRYLKRQENKANQ